MGRKTFSNQRNASAGAGGARRFCVGEIVRTKLRRSLNILGICLAAACLLWLSGCGGGTGANVVTVSVSPSSATVIVSQSLSLTAAVSGPTTNTNVTWMCQYTITPIATTAAPNPKTSGLTTCTSDTGTIPSGSNQLTVVFTAPSKVPDQTTFPNLVITITATSAQNTSKTGTATITLDSGIFVSILPTTASVPVGEQQSFSATLTNDLQTKGVKWLITQTAPTATIPLPSVATCAPGCGTLTVPANSNTVTYTAPSAIPTSTTVTSTPANVTIVATSNGDNTRFTFGTITIVAGGPITFNGISPTIAPAGARYWDIFLDAPNISSSSLITLTSKSTNNPTSLTSISGQVKILFPIPTTTVTSPGSTGARIRLNEQNLSTVDTYTVTVTDPVQTVTSSGTFSFQTIPVRPTSVASIPDDIVQGQPNANLQLLIDGGYFGLGGTNAAIFFQGNSRIVDPASSNSRQLLSSFSTTQAGPPGLYQLSVSGRATPPPAPLPYNSSITTVGVFPDYSVTPPSVVQSVGNLGSLTAGTNLSAIDIDPTLGIAAVADTGGNAILFFNVGKHSLTPLSTVTSATYPNVSINVPTGVSVNRQNHTVAVVNYGDQSVSVIPIPGALPAVTPFNVSLANSVTSLNATNTPYSIGVDPDTNLALVAYSNTSPTYLANVGFILNLNPDSATNKNPYGCPFNGNTAHFGQCIFAQVSLNTGSYPQIAVSPHGHLAFVTPGGSGPTTAVDLTKMSTSASITSLTLTSGIVTATVSGTNPLNPAQPGTVLITGVTAAGKTNFNGAYAVTSISGSTFTYSITSTTNDTGTGGTVYLSNPNLFFGISQTSQGIAMNPITRTAAIADANATGNNGPQINLVNGLDLTPTSITFNATCTFYTTTCAGAPELLGTTAVAWQPYSDALVSYNSGQNQVSVSDPTEQRRYALVCQLPTACTTNPVTASQVTLTGTGIATINVANAPGGQLKLFGGLAVDPDTNQALVVMSGSSSMELIDLGPSSTNSLKPAEITEVVVPNPGPGPGVIGGVPNALLSYGTLTATTDLSGVQIFGAGFGATGNTSVTVRLDGNPIPAGNVQVINDRQIVATIPASFLSFPHRYALDVLSSGSQSNASDFIVIQAVDLSKVCSTGSPKPSSVAIADQLANGPFSPIAIVSNSGCTSISVVDINPTTVVAGVTAANPNFGTVRSTIAVGATPIGVAIDQHRGLAVVANSGDNTASVVDLTQQPPVQKVPAVAVGTNPLGVAMNDATDVAVLANNGSQTVSLIDLALLFPPSGTTAPTTLSSTTASVDELPVAVAIDPDRGTLNQGIAVVTALQLVSGAAPVGALDVVDIGLETPSKSLTISTGSISSSPTGIVFDPTVFTGTTNNGVFYANSSGSNVISSFNPDTGTANSVNVGINPTSLAMNQQTGAILSVNTLGNSISIVDTLSNPLKTRQTLGIPGSPTFGVAIDQFTNLAVIVDQVNNRLLLFPMPN